MVTTLRHIDALAPKDFAKKLEEFASRIARTRQILSPGRLSIAEKRWVQSGIDLKKREPISLACHVMLRTNLFIADRYGYYVVKELGSLMGSMTVLLLHEEVQLFCKETELEERQLLARSLNLEPGATEQRWTWTVTEIDAVISSSSVSTWSADFLWNGDEVRCDPVTQIRAISS